jgi:hypothetical protein
MASVSAPARAPVPPAAWLPHTVRPGWHALRKWAGRPAPDILEAASDRWLIGEGTTVEVRPARFLPGQLERIRGAQFGSVRDVVRDFIGGFTSPQPPTMGFRVRDVTLVDGILYAGSAVRHLRRRTRRLAPRLQANAVSRPALFESWPGNRWFGNWLADDCVTYPLAEKFGCPVTTQPLGGSHAAEYERDLGMAPVRVADTWFDELILFDDSSHNECKRERASNLRRRLVGEEPPRHPGVFLLRGASGDRRELTNEAEIAGRLAANRGFQVLDPLTAPLSQIVEACGGAQVIAGVEGSHLVHGLMLMPEGAQALIIQPPDRAVSVLKLITDRQRCDFAFVVARQAEEPSTFTADADELERTLDLA